MLAIYTSRRQELPRFLGDALGNGADAFIYKEESTHFLNILLTLIDRKHLIAEAQKLQKLGGILSERDPGLVSASPTMQKILQSAAYLAPWRNEYVLILGEVGTGKTRLAKAIHECSPRADSPFVTLDPSHIGDTLVHAELFGARRGAYTGAVVNRKGLLESASGGTVFIDELENMSATMQEIMLRVIAEGKYNRPGEPEEHELDVRFLFATNVDPDELVTAGRLRRDLFSRINQHVLRLPRLEDRVEDIPFLAQSFVREFYSENLPGMPIPAITEAALAELRRAPWPDNIRGLRNVIRRSLVRLPRGANLDAQDLVLGRDSVLGQGGGTTNVNDSDIGVLLGLAPRAGSQRVIFEHLVDKVPDTVANEELNEAIGQARSAVATEPLMVAVSRLRTRLQQYGFSIRQEKDQKGYALVRLVEHV